MKGRIPSLEAPPPPYFKGSSRERRVSETPVMPAWTAGIQVRKDASGNIHVNLDSSTPCWNDGIERPLLEVTEVRLAFSKEDPKFKNTDIRSLRDLRVLRG